MMEVIIVLVIVTGIIGLLYFRSKGTSKVEKVEETHAWPATEHTVPVAEPEPPVAIVTEPVVETPVAEPEVVAKPKKARTKKATTDSATTEPKPAAKPRAKKPKMSVAK
jgi:hypothetical protein